MEVSEELIAKLGDACRRAFPMRLAVLFGSRARGDARASSDFDVAVLPVDRDLPLRDELALASTLSDITGTEVDVARLDGDDPTFEHEVALHSVLLYEARPGELAAFRADATSRWFDFEEAIAPHRRRFLARLAKGA